MMRLKTISIIGERITRPEEYPFNIPAIASLKTLEVTSRICFFVGENGTGKSTLLEAIAAHYGFGLEGGNRNFSPHTTESVTSVEPLVKALRLAFTKRTGGGFYLRAESFSTWRAMSTRSQPREATGTKVYIASRTENPFSPCCGIASRAPVST